MRIETEEELRNLWLAYKDAETRGHPLVESSPEEYYAKRAADYEHLKKIAAEMGLPLEEH
ncbi:MAG: hypothetical protein MJZ68_04295 [archaeon]|nr:hypothetical protein [archaeon]